MYTKYVPFQATKFCTVHSSLSCSYNIIEPFRGFTAEDVTPFNVKLWFIDEEREAELSSYSAHCSSKTGQVLDEMNGLESARDRNNRMTFQIVGLLPSTEYRCVLTRRFSGVEDALMLTVTTTKAGKLLYTDVPYTYRSQVCIVICWYPNYYPQCSNVQITCLQ